MSYTLGNGITKDWQLHEDGWKPGVDGNWTIVDWKMVPWVIQMLPNAGALPGSPSNNDAYMVADVDVYRWNSNTSAWDIIALTGNFLFYDQFTGNFYSWLNGVISVVFVTVLNTNGDMLYYDGGLQRLPIGNDFDIMEVQSGLPTWQPNPLRSLKIKRPSFKRHATIDTQIVVPASLSSVQAVKIDNIFYFNNTDLVIDATINGRNGLDTGALAPGTVYYLYAIPPLAGTTWDAVLSANDPNTGPVGFPLWSYLGSAPTAGGDFELFRFANGTLRINGSNNSVINVVAATAYPLIISTLAHSVYFRISWAVSGSNGADLQMGPTATDLNNFSQATNTSATECPVSFGEVIIETPQTIYASLTNGSDEVNANIFGWSECPEDYN